MEKFKLFSVVIIIYAIFSIATVPVTNCQEIDIVTIVQEIPDSLFQFETNSIGIQFSQDVRYKLFQDLFYHDSITSYSVESHTLYGVENGVNLDDNAISTYSVEVLKNLNMLSLSYEGSNYSTHFNFLLLQEGDSYSFILIKYYSHHFEMCGFHEISSYYFDRKKNKYIKKELPLPEFDWDDFYSVEDVSELNMYYLDGILPTPVYSLLSIDNELVISVSAYLDEIIVGFFGMLAHDFENGRNQWDEYSMCSDSLGFSFISESRDLLYSFPDFELLDEQEFQLSYLFNSFCKKFAQNWDLDFFFQSGKLTIDKTSDDVKYDIKFSDSVMNISSDINGLDIKGILIHINHNDYFIICYNTSGNEAESQIRIAGRNNHVLFSEVKDKLILKAFDNSDFGINYPENVFEKFPEVFKLRYKIEKDSLNISLLINHPLDNKEAKRIINQIKDLNINYNYAWSDLFKK